jgi:D-arabinose 1-dehydrogenase-like Zn-dependent alcohol dehydrogenase
MRYIYSEKLAWFFGPYELDCVRDDLYYILIEPAIRCAEPDGAVVMVAYIDVGQTLNLDLRFVQSMEIRLIGARGNTRQELTKVVQLVARHQLRPPIAGHFPLEKAYAALTQLVTGEVTGRIVLVP